MTCTAEQAQAFIHMCNAIGTLDHLEYVYASISKDLMPARLKLQEEMIKLSEEMGLTKINFTVGSDDHMMLERLSGDKFSEKGYDIPCCLNSHFRPYFG